MKFAYKALDSAGFIKQGQVDASTNQEALNFLFELGYKPIELKVTKSDVSIWQSSASAQKKIRHADLVGMIRELATLISSGVALAEAFATLQEAIAHQGLQEAIAKILVSIRGGEGFSVAIKKSDLRFPEYVHALARAGEATGNIGEALSRCADQLEFDEKMRIETKEALTYPMILVITGVCAITFVFSFVVPRFAGLLKGRSVDLPWLSEVVLRTGVFVNANWFGVAVVLLVLTSFGIVAGKNKKIRSAAVLFISRLPLVATWIQGSETARWTSILAVLVKSRVPILLSLELSATAVFLPDSAARLRSVGDAVRRGKALSLAIEERGLLEGTSLSMLKVGEKTGELAVMLGYVSSHTADRHRISQRRLVSLIEPLSILIIGLVLGVIMVGVVLAMTALTEVKL